MSASLLDVDHDPHLARLSREATLVALDFDGTLAPLVPHRDEAAMRPATAALFAALCARYPTVVISGRSRADVAARLSPQLPVTVIGNHGGETLAESVPRVEAITALMRKVAQLLQPLLRADVELEDKRLSLTLHVRGAFADARVGTTQTMAAMLLEPLRERVKVSAGHRVVNILPVDAPDKGAALLTLRDQLATDHVLFVGDDATDEDVFRLDAPWLFGVRIGFSPTSAARYFLPSQADIDPLLARLLQARPAGLPWGGRG